jgi:hypothetical protein
MSTDYRESRRANAKIFYPVLAVACALRIIFDIHNGYWSLTRGFFTLFGRLLPCVPIAGGVTFFWNLFRHKN